jgi:hypothetical protein
LIDPVGGDGNLIQTFAEQFSQADNLLLDKIVTTLSSQLGLSKKANTLVGKSGDSFQCTG